MPTISDQSKFVQTLHICRDCRARGSRGPFQSRGDRQNERERERERMGSNRKLREVEWCAIPATLALLILHFRLLDGPGEMKPVM